MHVGLRACACVNSTIMKTEKRQRNDLCRHVEDHTNKMAAIYAFVLVTTVFVDGSLTHRCRPTK